MKAIEINQVAVLGSGVMGAQIAAHFANAKIPVLLFDLKSKPSNAFVIDALKNLQKLTPAPFGSANSINYITPANYEDDLTQLKNCALIIEVIAERIDYKQALYHKISSFIEKNTIVASNTSGLSIEKLASFLPSSVQKSFCGIHFFNPPRYMPLVELIPHQGTTPETLDQLETFLVRLLGKSIIRAKDTPNFIANRLGVFSMLVTCYYGQKFDIPLEVIDGLTGKKLGRAKSATYRTADIVGLDTFAHVVNTMKENLNDGWEHLYCLPVWLSNLINQGALGQKTKKGIYYKDKDGLKVFDLRTEKYRPSNQTPDNAVLNILAETEDWAIKLAKLHTSHRPQAQFLYACLRDIFHYAATLVGEISNYPHDMDMASCRVD